MRIIKLSIIIASVVFFSFNAGGQEYPAKPVQFVIPFTPGSATDFVGRLIGQQLSDMWGQQVTFVNQEGAGGTMGIDAVAKAAADGYTLLATSSAFTVSPALHSKLPYDPLKAFIDIAPLASQPMALIVGANSGITSVTKVIEMAREKPGSIKFGSPGKGSAAHLAAEQFKSATKIDVVHHPYKGGPEVIAATNDGSVTYSFLPMSLAMKGTKDGKLVTLGVTSPERTTAMPEVPTLAESGVPGFKSIVWWGIWAPTGTPGSIAKKLEKDIATALAAPNVVEGLKKGGYEPMSMTSEEFAKFVRSDMESVSNIVKEAGITAE